MQFPPSFFPPDGAWGPKPPVTVGVVFCGRQSPGGHCIVSGLPGGPGAFDETIFFLLHRTSSFFVCTPFPLKLLIIHLPLCNQTRPPPFNDHISEFVASVQNIHWLVLASSGLLSTASDSSASCVGSRTVHHCSRFVIPKPPAHSDDTPWGGLVFFSPDSFLGGCFYCLFSLSRFPMSSNEK